MDIKEMDFFFFHIWTGNCLTPNESFEPKP